MANLHIRNGGQEREDEPMIKQSSMKRILQDKDHQYNEMRQSLHVKIKEKDMEVGLHLHNEKNYLRIIKEKERLTYIVGAVTFLLGGGLGWLIP